MENKLRLVLLLIIPCMLLIVKGNANAAKLDVYYMLVNEKKDIPVSFYDGNYYFHSSNLKVLQFSKDGKMIALKSGTVKVVLTHIKKDGKKITTSFKVSVQEKVKKIKWEKKYNSIDVGEKVKFKISYKAKRKKNIDFVWKSSNPEVAKVDDNGNVVGNSQGSTVISCSAKNQKKPKVKCKLKVKKGNNNASNAETPDIPVTSIKINLDSLKLKVGDNYNLVDKTDIQPINASNRLLNITSSNENVIKVNYGILYAVGSGTATISVSAIDGSGSNASLQVVVDRFLRKDDTKFIAHRGLSWAAPENTMKAFELASKNGFYAIETDIWISKDDKFIISHDSNLSRTCGINSEIGNMSSDEIRRVKIKYGNNYDEYSNDYSATHIPTMSQFLVFCRDNDIVPMIEVKFPNVSDAEDDIRILNKLYEEIYSIMGNRKVYLISFHYNFIINMSRILKEKKNNSIELRFLIDVYENTEKIPIYQFCKNNSIGFSMRKENEDELIKTLMNEGNSVGLWTINDKDEAIKYIDMGIDFVVTDNIIWNDD